jgi:putative molybdopterin biosynthesis protein
VATGEVGVVTGRGGQVERQHIHIGDTVPADPVGEAFRTWLRCCAIAGWKAELGVETVSVREARGRVTDEPVRARWSVPAYRAAAMDGIAVAARDLPDRYPSRLHHRAFTRVDTGDPVPDEADTVITREDLTFAGDGSVEILTHPARGRHVRPIGEDVTAGAILLPAGHRIRAVDAAAVAAAGHISMTVRRRPVVAILPTGDEIKPLGTSLRPGEILDTNSLMLAGMVEDAGCAVLALPVAPDVPEQIASVLADAADRADIVLVIGGSSAGRDDHTGSVIDGLGRVAVHGVAMRPGHPVILGVLGGEFPGDDLGRPAAPAVPVMGVPGYPASAERAFHCYLRPLIRRILDTGAPRADDHAVAARLACAVTSPTHIDEYLKVRLARVTDPRTAEEHLVAVPLPRGSGALSTMAQAEAMLRIPAGTAGIASGTTVRAVPVAGAAFGAGTTLIAGSPTPATNALAELHRADLAACVLRWSDLSPEEALDALASGLCHAAALALPVSSTHPAEESMAALAARLGPITVLEIARNRDLVEVLVVPAGAFDSRPVEGLRSTLNAMTFRQRLRDCSGYTSRSTGRETWHGPSTERAEKPGSDTSGNGAARCATR